MKVIRSVDITGAYAAGRMLRRFHGAGPWPANLRLVQFAHGWPAQAKEFNPGGPLTVSTSGIIKALAESGRYLPFAADQGGTNLFGQTPAVPTDIEAAFAWMVARHAARANAVALIGYSQGFLNAAAEVFTTPGKVRALIGIAPMVNGANVYADNAAIRADMDASAAGSWAGVDAVRSPSGRTADFAGVRVATWQGDVDATVRAADTAAFAAATGATNRVIGGDHSTLWFNVQAADVLAELDAANWS